MKTLREMAFSWIPKDFKDKGNLIKLIAKTESTTVHPESPNYPVRIFSAEELKRTARTLIDKPVRLNHKSTIPFAKVIDAEYNDEVIEAYAWVPNEYINKVRDGLIESCSIEFDWRTETKTEAGVEFSGLVMKGVSLIDDQLPKNMKAGDDDAKVTLFEAASKTGAFESTIELAEAVDGEEPPDTEEPFAGYADLEACVLDNQGRSDPAGYCAVIIKQQEDAAKVPALEAALVEEKAKSGELDESMAKLVETTTEVTTDVETKVEEARKEATEAFREKVKGIKPSYPYRADQTARLLISRIDKLIKGD